MKTTTQVFAINIEQNNRKMPTTRDPLPREFQLAEQIRKEFLTEK